MTVPVEYDFAIVKFSDMAVVPVFTALCGPSSVNVNEQVETQERRRRDCATPGIPGAQYLKSIGTSWTASVSGATNSEQHGTLKTALFAKKVDYRFEYYKDDGTATGDLLATLAGKAIMTGLNTSVDQEGDASLEVTLTGEGVLTHTIAP